MVSTHPMSICALTTIRPTIRLMMKTTYALTTLVTKSTCITDTSSVDDCLLVLMIKRNMGATHEAMLGHFMPSNGTTMSVATSMVMNGMAMRVNSNENLFLSICVCVVKHVKGKKI